MGNQAGSPRKKKLEKGGIQVPGGSGDACSSKLVSDMFDLRLIGHHGLPSQPGRVCYVPMLGLLVVATGYQQLKVYGQDGLEVYLPCRAGDGGSSISAGATATFLDYTSSGKIVLVMSDSAIQVIDLALLQEGKDVVVASLPSSWTTSRITAVETIRHHKDTPFFYVALDDGSVQVVQESTCHFASYTIYPDDVGVVGAKDQEVYVSAMACSPTDPNQLLLAYESSDVVYVWDVAKQRVVSKTQPTSSPSPVRSLAWHASGKRFAAAHASGAVSVCRSDKQQQATYAAGVFFPPAATAGGFARSPSDASVSQRIFWLTTNSASPGALIVSLGKGLAVCFPSRDAQKGPKEALSELSTPSKDPSSFPWQSTLVPTHNNATAMDFAIASLVVPAASSNAPFTAIVLAGNPLDGVKPSLAMHVLPCLLALPHTPKEEWLWMASQAPAPSPVSTTSHHLQASDIVAMQVVDLRAADKGAFRDDLFASQPILHDDDCDIPAGGESGAGAFPAAAWANPLTGGSTTTAFPSPPPLLLSSSTVEDDGGPTFAVKESHTKRAAWVVTAHADSRVKVWEALPPADGASRGQLHLLHVLRAKPVLQDPIAQVLFSPTSRLLVVGTTTGEVAFFTFASATGFSFVFSLHVHSSAIAHMAATPAMDVAISDAFGVVSIIHVASQTYKLAVFDLALDDDDDSKGSVDSLLMHGSALFVGRGNGHVEVYDIATAALLLTCTTGRAEELAKGAAGVSTMLLMDENGRRLVPVDALAAPPLHHDEKGESSQSPLVVDAATQALVDDLVGKFPSPATPLDESKCITVCVEPGPLGIFLVDDVPDRAVLRGFVSNDANARLQQARGVVPGSALVRINGVDMRQLKKADVVAAVGSLAGVAKQLTYELPPDTTEAPSPYLVIALGRTIQVFQTEVPAPVAMLAEADDGTKAPPVKKPVVHVDVDADVELRAAVAAMAITAIPVEGRMEQALVVLDQTGCVYVLALPTLRVHPISGGYAFDHGHVHVNASGTVVLGTLFGDIAEYSIYSADMLAEVTMLQWATAQTQLVSAQSQLQSTDISRERVVEKKGSGFLKLFAAKEVDLNTVFVVPSVEEEQRKQLMGDRQDQPRAKDATATTESNLSGTMDALHQASQNLHLRGEKLSGLEEKTERLKNRADEFYNTMKAFNEKEAKKKWYQL